MKRNLALCLLATALYFVGANSSAEVFYGTRKKFKHSTEITLSKLPKADKHSLLGTKKVIPFMHLPSKPKNFCKRIPADTVEDQVARNVICMPPSPRPRASFNGLVDSQTVIPPDTQGSVGINHLMVTLNDRVRVLAKNGTVLTTVLLESFFKLSPGNSAFDPRVLYDPYRNRWVVAAASNEVSSNSQILLAVSATSNPLGGWYIHYIKADQAGNAWADFPTMGFNKDWIVIQANMFSVSSDEFVGSNIYVFNKNNLYQGGSGFFTLFSQSSIGATQVPALTYSPTLPALYLVQDFSGAFGLLRIFSITGPVGAERLTAGPFVQSSKTWGSEGPFINGGLAPQKGTSQRIDTGDSRMQSVVFRNGFLWCAQTIFLPTAQPTRSSVQWWQLTVGGGIAQQGRVDDPTANLISNGNFFAYPSIAVNKRNDVLVGYSQFSKLRYASGAYSFRFSIDPINRLDRTLIYVPGLAPYTKDFGSGVIRWGDYSSTVVDPANDITMWTLQEYAQTPASGESRWGTWWASVL